jgi:WD40 repeat protein
LVNIQRHACVGSQVCNLLWSKEVNEIVSTHGFCHNQIVLWRAPSLARLATLSGHTKRVLYLTASPDEQAIVTGAGAELHHACQPGTCFSHIAGPLDLTEGACVQRAYSDVL